MPVGVNLWVSSAVHEGVIGRDTSIGVDSNQFAEMAIGVLWCFPVFETITGRYQQCSIRKKMHFTAVVSWCGLGWRGSENGFCVLEGIIVERRSHNGGCVGLGCAAGIGQIDQLIGAVVWVEKYVEIATLALKVGVRTTINGITDFTSCCDEVHLA